MSSLVLRECNSEKACSKCDKNIEKGEQYMAGPYKALCLNCYEIEKKESVSSTGKGPNNAYIVSGTCAYCSEDAIGVLWNKKVCAAHINQVITESL